MGSSRTAAASRAAVLVWRLGTVARILSRMTTNPAPSFEHLLSARALIGWGKPVWTVRPTSNALYEFGGGLPDPESFPYEGMIEATRQVMAEDGAAAMTYGDPQGYRGLRELICHKYELYEGLKVAPENILVTNGSGHGLGLVFSAFLDVGDAMICETPAFSGTLSTLRRHGPRVLEAPIDSEGIVTTVVRERLSALRREGKPCKLIYTIVNFQNPAGPSQSLRRRHELVELAHEFETLILEDDAYGELRFEGQPLPPLYGLDGAGRVIRAGTVSKILGAGVRLGWLCAPRDLIPALQGFLFGGGVNPFMSRVATYFLRDHMVPHVQRLVGAAARTSRARHPPSRKTARTRRARRASRSGAAGPLRDPSRRPRARRAGRRRGACGCSR